SPGRGAAPFLVHPRSEPVRRPGGRPPVPQGLCPTGPFPANRGGATPVKLVTNGTVWMGKEEGFQEGTDVLIDGARIAAVGKGLAAEGHRHKAEVVDATGHLVLPGFVNAHCHAAMTLL